MIKKTLLIIVLLIILTSCNAQIPFINNSSGQGNYTGSDYKGNYVWGGAMNLAWNELNYNILHDKLKLNTNDKDALAMVAKLNQAVFSKNDLDEASYYIKSGYGQQIVDLINKESRQKFPDKNFSDLDLQLSPLDIISYAYFLKKVEYPIPFKEKDVNFQAAKVKGFYASDQNQKDNVKIIKYWNDNKFIICLTLKDKNDELILAKGFAINKPADLVSQIVSLDKGNLPSLAGQDIFSMPKLHLDLNRQYNEIIDKFLANTGFEKYKIKQMYENIKFDMDQKGARVENEAVIGVYATGIALAQKHKEFILDKPFWVVMKRASSPNPYFILGLNNSELMIK